MSQSFGNPAFMLAVTEITGRVHYLALETVAQVSKTAPSAGWHGCNALVRTTTGQMIEAREKPEELLRTMARLLEERRGRP